MRCHRARQRDHAFPYKAPESRNGVVITAAAYYVLTRMALSVIYRQEHS